MKIVFRNTPFDAGQKQALNELAQQAGFETLWCENGYVPTEDELADCEIMMGYFPIDLFRQVPSLKWLQVPCAGVEKYCRDIYADPDVILTNCSGAFGIAIAEYMLTGLLMLMRNMPAYIRNQRAHDWKCAGLCRSIFGSTITVIGTGDIGSAFAARVKALGAHIRGVRRSAGPIPANFDEVYTSDRIVDAVRGADAVVMCLPATQETAGIVSDCVIGSMASNTILVNCGRGATLDQEALVRALNEKRIAGAVLDVFTAEPLAENDPLWDMENVIITPHISGHDDDPVNSCEIYSIFMENLKRRIENKPLMHVVDRTRGY